MKKKILISSIAMIALCLCIIAGSTFALFTDTTEVSIAVTAGKLDVDASIIGGSERMVSLNDYNGVDALTPSDFAKVAFDNGGTAVLGTGTEDDGNGIEEGKLVISGMTPGDGVCFQVKVENKGDVALQYTVKASPDAQTPNHEGDFYGALEVIVYDVNGVKLEGNNAYAEVGEWTTFYVAVVFPNSSSDQNMYQGASAGINFTVEVVQANGVENGQLITGN